MSVLTAIYEVFITIHCRNRIFHPEHSRQPRPPSGQLCRLSRESTPKSQRPRIQTGPNSIRSSKGVSTETKLRGHLQEGLE